MTSSMSSPLDSPPALHCDTLPAPAELTPAQMELNDRLAGASRRAELGRLLVLGADPKANDSRALYRAASNGFAECVAMLIPFSGPEADTSEALKIAALLGHEECVQLLIPVANISHDHYSPLRWAAGAGHASCVRLLMSEPPPLDLLADVFSAAASEGSVGVVAVLLDCMPMLLGEDGLSQSRQEAGARGFAELSALLSSIIEARELSAAAPAPQPNARGGKAARL